MNFQSILLFFLVLVFPLPKGLCTDYIESEAVMNYNSAFLNKDFAKAHSIANELFFHNPNSLPYLREVAKSAGLAGQKVDYIEAMKALRFARHSDSLIHFFDVVRFPEISIEMNSSLLNDFIANNDQSIIDNWPKEVPLSSAVAKIMEGKRANLRNIEAIRFSSLHSSTGRPSPSDLAHFLPPEYNNWAPRKRIDCLLASLKARTEATEALINTFIKSGTKYGNMEPEWAKIDVLGLQASIEELGLAAYYYQKGKRDQGDAYLSKAKGEILKILSNTNLDIAGTREQFKQIFDECLKEISRQ